MALPLPMLSVLLSTLFACSLAFRDCKKTRESVSERSDAPVTRQGGSEVNIWMCMLVDVCEGERLGVRGGRERACV